MQQVLVVTYKGEQYAGDEISITGGKLFFELLKTTAEGKSSIGIFPIQDLDAPIQRVRVKPQAPPEEPEE